MGTDLTARKHAEEQLRKTAAELERSNQDLEQFAYIASHDLQEPLRMVSGYLQLLQMRYKDQLDKDANEFISFAVDGASRMKEMIIDLLAYSRVGTKGRIFKPTNAEQVLQQVLATLQITIEKNEAIVTHDPLPTVTADESQLAQIFQNLISNGIKFHGDEAPRVHVSAKPVERDWVFSVHDNGIGIDSKYFDRIFTIFERLHGQGRYPGTGIGLSICKKIIARHNGRIWLESELGQGTTFYFSIPR